MILRHYVSLILCISILLASCGVATSSEQKKDTTSSSGNISAAPAEKISAKTSLDSFMAFIPNDAKHLMLLNTDKMSLVDYSEIMSPFGDLNSVILAGGIRAMPMATTMALGDTKPATYALFNTNEDGSSCVWFYIPSGTATIKANASSKIQGLPYRKPLIGAWGTLVLSEHVVVLVNEENLNPIASVIVQKKAGQSPLAKEFTLPEGLVAEICGGASGLSGYEKINFTLADQRMPDYSNLSTITINKTFSKGTNVTTEISNTQNVLNTSGGAWDLLKERGEFTPDVNKFTYVVKLRAEDQTKLLNIDIH